MKIAVLSRGRKNYSTQRLVEEIKKRGHKAQVVNHAECYVEIEQDTPDVRYRGEDISGIDAVVPRIGASITRYGTAIVRQFEMMGVYTPAKSIAIQRSRDKLRSMQVLSKAGVGIPRTIFSRETNEVDDLVDLIGAPMIIKVARGTHGRGVVLAETKKAAKSVIQAFYVEGVSILLQEYVEESAGSDVRALVVGGRVVASMQRQSLTDDFRSNIHQGGEGKKVKLTDEERKTAIKAAKAMGLSVSGVDMVRSKRGPLVLEVNSSPGLKGIETVTGRNVAEKIVDYIEINAKRKPKKDKIGA
ncbi:MAG TPA: 30S ribosomal protein S6--L-glutamate ligase [Candidatus Saccharimonadales bacterium]|jgi:ribosomal protein S6--L-glutamate ligase